MCITSPYPGFHKNEHNVFLVFSTVEHNMKYSTHAKK